MEVGIWELWHGRSCQLPFQTNYLGRSLGAYLGGTKRALSHFIEGKY